MQDAIALSIVAGIGACAYAVLRWAWLNRNDSEMRDLAGGVLVMSGLLGIFLVLTGTGLALIWALDTLFS